jgi:hypothetical protein
VTHDIPSYPYADEESLAQDMDDLWFNEVQKKALESSDIDSWSQVLLLTHDAP